MAEYDLSDEQYDFSDFEEPEKEYDFSDFEDDKPQSPADDFSTEQRRYDEMILAPLGAVSETIDKYTGAPIRAGIGALQQGKGFGEAASIAGSQFGEDTSGVPSGKDIMANMGMSTEEFSTPLIADPTAKGKDRFVQASPAGIAGGVAEGLTDPTMVLPYGGAAKAYSKLSPKVTKHLMVRAGEKAAQTVTGNSIPELRKMYGLKPGQATPKALERGALNTGYSLLGGNKKLGTKPVVGSVFSTPEKAANIAEKNIGKIGGYYDEIGNALDTTGTKFIDARDAANEVLEIAADIVDTGGGDAIKNQILDELVKLERYGEIDFATAQKIKAGYQYEPQNVDSWVSKKDLVNKMNQAVDSAMKKGVMRAAKTGVEIPGGNDLFETFISGKKAYGPNVRAMKAGAEQSARGQARNMLSPSTMGLGGVGTVVGSTVGGLAAGPTGAAVGGAVGGGLFGGARALGIKYGDAAMARTYYKMSQLAKTNSQFSKKYGKILEIGAKAGPRGLVMYHNLLMNNDPGYAAYFDEKEPEIGPMLDGSEQGSIPPEQGLEEEGLFDVLKPFKEKIVADLPEGAKGPANFLLPDGLPTDMLKNMARNASKKQVESILKRVKKMKEGKGKIIEEMSDLYDKSEMDFNAFKNAKGISDKSYSGWKKFENAPKVLRDQLENSIEEKMLTKEKALDVKKSLDDFYKPVNRASSALYNVKHYEKRLEEVQNSIEHLEKVIAKAEELRPYLKNADPKELKEIKYRLSQFKRERDGLYKSLSERLDNLDNWKGE